MANTSAKVRNRWNRENYFRIQVTVPKGMRAEIQSYAKEKNTTVNYLINILLINQLGLNPDRWDRIVNKKETMSITERL